MEPRKNKSILVAILGAESSGKSELTEALADHYHSDAVYEYARAYMSSPELSYAELEHIAATQIQWEEDTISSSTTPYIFFDTEIINLQVWFELVYGHMPDWLESMRYQKRYDLYLVTENDLDWEPDTLRQNSDLEFREDLKRRYIAEIKRSDTPYEMVSGQGSQRVEMAIGIIDEFGRQKH